MSKHHLQIQQDVSLKRYTTIGIGGKARYFVKCHHSADIIAALHWAKTKEVSTLILGGGSNLLFPDEGYNGLIIQPAMREIQYQVHSDQIRLTVEAGMPWDDFVAHTVAQNWAGIECLSGIPGHVGAAPIQNIGAYGQELAQVCTKVTYIDKTDFKIKERTDRECAFGYRASFFKRPNPQEIVTSVSMTLTKDGSATLNYGNLKEQLGENPTLQATRDAVLKTRSSKGMVFKTDDIESHGCGSFFTNPILDNETYQDFLKYHDGPHPNWPQTDGQTKLSAAWLIENSGFHKGYELGKARLNKNHCLAIINPGEAKATDVLKLKETIQAGVKERFNIALEPEPVIVSEP